MPNIHCILHSLLCEQAVIYGTNVTESDHLPNCTKYPEPCPNQCEIGTVPRCDMEKHLTQCPLQLVECEFVQAGCQVRVPRRDLARHVEEGGQRHLLNMSLLNLSLTKELHQKMAEKDQQIAELQEQLQEQSSKLEKQIKDLQQRTEKQLQTQLTDLQQNIQQQANQIAGVQQTGKHLQTHLKVGLNGLHGQVQKQDGKLAGLRQKFQQQVGNQITGVQLNQLEQKLTRHGTETERQITKETGKQISGLQLLLRNETETLRTTLQQQVQEQGKQIHDSLCLLSGFSPPFKITLTRFSVHKARGGDGEWKSDPFYSHTGGYKFLLGIDTNGYQEVQGTHITADLDSLNGEYDGNLFWPIQITAHLQLLNQRGDHGHVVATLKCREVNKGFAYREFAREFIAHSKLGYNALKDTQYLKDDCLHFQLYLKVDPDPEFQE